MKETISHTAIEIDVANHQTSQETKKYLPELASCAQHPLREFLFIYPAALGNAVGTWTTYMQSILVFTSHIKGENPTLDLSSTRDETLFILFNIFNGITFISNMRSFPRRERAFYFSEKMPGERPSSKYFFRTISALSSLWKAGVSSSSLYALLNSFMGSPAAATITIALSFGNLFSQLATVGNFDTGFIKNRQLAILATLYSAPAYAISNGALYFNTFDAVFDLLDLLSGRVTELNSPAKIALFIINVIGTGLFTVRTCTSYYEKNAKVISKQSIDRLELEEIHETLLPLLSEKRKSNINKKQLAYHSAVTVFKSSVMTLAALAIADHYGLTIPGYIAAPFMLLATTASQYTLYGKKAGSSGPQYLNPNGLFASVKNWWRGAPEPASEPLTKLGF